MCRCRHATALGEGGSQCVCVMVQLKLPRACCKAANAVLLPVLRTRSIDVPHLAHLSLASACINRSTLTQRLAG